MFIPNQLVISKRTGMTYRIIGETMPTLDGRRVYMVRSNEVDDHVVPILAAEIEEL